MDHLERKKKLRVKLCEKKLWSLSGATASQGGNIFLAYLRLLALNICRGQIAWLFTFEYLSRSTGNLLEFDSSSRPRGLRYKLGLNLILNWQLTLIELFVNISCVVHTISTFKAWLPRLNVLYPRCQICSSCYRLFLIEIIFIVLIDGKSTFTMPPKSVRYKKVQTRFPCD